jgi:hypothetical protein
MTIAICCSADFYAQANKTADQLKELGYKVLVPKTADIMRGNGDYDASHYKTWFDDSKDYKKKADLMRGHFEKITLSDCILVINDKKHNQPNYIGGNVLMEMAISFFLNKPIYILNEIPEKSGFLEEIKGMMPIVLHGQLSALVTP